MVLVGSHGNNGNAQVHPVSQGMLTIIRKSKSANEILQNSPQIYGLSVLSRVTFTVAKRQKFLMEGPKPLLILTKDLTNIIE